MDNNTQNRSFSTMLKGIIILERLQYSFLCCLIALAGVFIATEGSISELNYWVPIKVCFLFLIVNSTAHPINDYFDRKADIIGRKNAPIPSGMLTIKQVKIVIIMNYVIALPLIFILSPNPFTVIFALLHLLSGVIYSAPPLRMCKRAIGGFATIAIGALMMPLLGGWSSVANGKYDHVLLFLCGGYLFILITQRMVADIADMSGDKRSGRMTVPLVFGKSTTFRIGIATTIGGILLFFGAYFVSDLNISYLLIWGLSSFILISTLIKYKKEENEAIARQYSEKLMLPLIIFTIGIIMGAI